MWPNDVRKSDLDVQFMRAGGPGGQNQNKVSSACRITHIPTGISAESREHRDQPQNKAAAFRKLAKRLVPLMLEAQRTGQPPAHVDPATQVRVRTYDLHHRRGVDERGPRFDPVAVLDGDGVCDLIDAVRFAAHKGSKEQP